MFSDSRLVEIFKIQMKVLNCDVCHIRFNPVLMYLALRYIRCKFNNIQYIESNNYNIFGPDVIPGTLYDFSGTYTSESDPTPGEGYWLNFSDSGTVNIIGSLISSIEINLSQGWNLISGISEPVNIEDIVDPEGIIVPESIYGYSGTYTPEVVIEPWKGYWINVNADGTITLNQS